MPEHPNQVPLDSRGTFEARLSRGDWTPQIVFIDTEGNEFALRFIGGARSVRDIVSKLALECATLFKNIEVQGWLDLWGGPGDGN